MKNLIGVCIYLCCLWVSAAQPVAITLLVEAESFDTGGWVIDQQSMDQMGSPYLLAHGLGIPVADATISVDFPQNGDYRLYLNEFKELLKKGVPHTNHPDRSGLRYDKVSR